MSLPTVDTLIKIGNAELARRELMRKATEDLDKTAAQRREKNRKKKAWLHVLAEAQVDLEAVWDHLFLCPKTTHPVGWDAGKPGLIHIRIPGCSTVVAEYHCDRNGCYALEQFTVERWDRASPDRKWWEVVHIDRDGTALGVALAMARKQHDDAYVTQCDVVRQPAGNYKIVPIDKDKPCSPKWVGGVSQSVKIEEKAPDGPPEKFEDPDDPVEFDPNNPGDQVVS